MNVHHLTLIASILLISSAVFFAVTVNVERLSPGVPGVRQAEPIQPLSLNVPDIKNFDMYYGREGIAAEEIWRHRNPFAPSARRLEEERILTRKERAPEKNTILPDPPDMMPERIVQLPTWGPPSLNQNDLQRPVIMGAIGTEDGDVVWVRFGEKQTLYELSVGEAAEGWTLESVDLGMATFLNGDIEVELPLGVSGITPIPVDLASNDPDLPDPKGKKNVDPDAKKANADMAKKMLSFLSSNPQGRQLLQHNPGLRTQIMKNPQNFIELVTRFQGGAGSTREDWIRNNVRVNAELINK